MNLSLEQLEELISTNQWYHQGFDGIPLFLSFVGEAEVRVEDRKPAGMEGEILLCFFSHGRANWYFGQSDLERGVAVMSDLAKHDPHISKKLLAAWKADEDRFEQLFAQYDASKLPALDDAALLAMYATYRTALVARYSSTSIIDHFALGSDQLFADTVRMECGPFENEEAFHTLFAALTAPVFRSFIHDGELALYDLAEHETPEGIAEYIKHFFWKKNNYVASHRLTTEEVAAEIAHIRETVRDIPAARTALLESPKRNADRKIELLQQHHVSPFLHALIEISDDFSWWQDQRKRASFLATSIFDLFLQECARRCRIDHELLKYALPDEINAALLAGQGVTADTLRERQEQFMIVYARDGLQMYTGEDVLRLREAMKQSEQHQAGGALHGLIANTGIAEGPVRVITSVTQIAEVQPGDVIVAVMTRPDYLPAMKKAVAIVTDEGGITCHAAIVSRELHIPCIIGTKVATKTLQNGQRVRVDANTNTITVL